MYAHYYNCVVMPSIPAIHFGKTNKTMNVKAFAEYIL